MCAGVQLVNMDFTDSRTRRMRREGLSFRRIAAERALSRRRVRASLASAPAGWMRRELRAEIRRAGGFTRWWRP